MQLNNLQLALILEGIPLMEVSLSWLHDQGQGHFEKELKINQYILNTNFMCYESGTFDKGDMVTPPSFASDGVEVCEVEANIFNSHGEEMNLTPEQKAFLIKEIQISVHSN